MTSNESAAAPDPATLSKRERLVVLATGTAWLLGIRGALLVLAAVLESSPLPEAVLGALIVDLGTGRAGVAWAERELGRGEGLRLIAKGAAVGGGVAALALGLALALGYGVATPASMHATALVGLIPAAAVAIRDELLYRGLPLAFAARAGVPVWAAIAFGALASPSAFAGSPHATGEALMLAVANGALFGVVYAKTKSAWAAVGAHAAWAMLTDVAARGGLFEVRWSTGEIASADAASGPPAYVAAGLAIAATAVLVVVRSKAARSRRGKSRRPGKAP